MKVRLIVDGGAMKPGPAVAQQLGPMGINLGKVIDDVNKETIGFKGIKVPVQLDVNTKTKEYTIEVFSPPASEMIKKELGLEKGSGRAGTTFVGNAAFETVLKIAKSKQSGLLARDLLAAVKTVVGTCASLGVLIDNKLAIEVGSDIEEGIYETQIVEEITEVAPEKKKKLDEYFAKIKTEQDKKAKALEEAKAAEEAAKTTAAAPIESGEKKEEPKKVEIQKVEKKAEGKKK